MISSTAVCGGLLLALVAAAAQADELAGSHVSAAELLQLIEAGRAPTIVDVRTRSEYDSAHVPGALHIPFWSVFGRSDEVPTPKDSPIVVYCEHGPRAGLAKAAFRASGFERVVYLEGHMSGWKKAGLPTEAVSPRNGGLRVPGASMSSHSSAGAGWSTRVVHEGRPAAARGVRTLWPM